jgi:hypothetical protein
LKKKSLLLSIAKKFYFFEIFLKFFEIDFISHQSIKKMKIPRRRQRQLQEIYARRKQLASARLLKEDDISDFDLEDVNNVNTRPPASSNHIKVEPVDIKKEEDEKEDEKEEEKEKMDQLIAEVNGRNRREKWRGATPYAAAASPAPTLALSPPSPSPSPTPE